jgi:hypothetical protein
VWTFQIVLTCFMYNFLNPVAVHYIEVHMFTYCGLVQRGSDDMPVLS